MDPFAELWGQSQEPVVQGPLAKAFTQFARMQPNQAAVLGLRPGDQAELSTFGAPGGANFTVAKKVAPQFQGFLNELAGSGYSINPQTSGGYNNRNIAGSNRLSQHAYGNAIDLNWDVNPQGSARHNLPENIKDMAAKYGLTWGGTFSRPDPMHFEASRIIGGLPPVAAAGPTQERKPMGDPFQDYFGPPTGGAPKPRPVNAAPGPLDSLVPGIAGGGDQPGYFGNLFANPTFLQGAAVLGGGLQGQDFGSALQRGSQAAASAHELQIRQRKLAAWNRMFGGPNGPDMSAPLLKGVPPEIVPLIAQMEPEEGLHTLTQIAFKKLAPHQLTSVPAGGSLYDEQAGKVAFTAPPKTDAPAGYRATPEGNLEAIQGGPATHVPGEQAGRIALMRQARSDLEQAKTVFGGDMGITGRLAKGFGIGETGAATRTVQTAVEATLRALSGAAAPQSEVDRYNELFSPSVYDGPKTRMDKLRRLEDFITEAEQTIMQGRGGVAPLPSSRPGAAPGGQGKAPHEMTDAELKAQLGIE